MTFVEAAIELLRLQGGPLHFKELTDRAIKQNLLTHVGRAPEQMMQARLAEETKKGGADQMLVRVKPGVFGLKSYEKKKARRGRGKKEEVEVEAGTPEEAILAAEMAEELPALVDEGTDYEALAKEYEGELGAPATAPVEGEMVDEQTADEDRPMLDEIMARDSRRGRDRGRGRGRDRGRGRGRDGDRKPEQKPEQKQQQPQKQEQRQRQNQKQEQRQPQKQPQRPPQPQRQPQPKPPVPTPIVLSEAPRSGAESKDGLADITFGLLKALNDPRPVHARQLAAMAIKRKLVAGDVEDLWRQVQLALIDDVRARHGRGLRPRVRHQGGGLFALATVQLEDELGRAEESVAERLEALHLETRRALRQRLARLSVQALERLARVYLERTGWRDLERAKRVDNTAYLIGRAPQGAVQRRILVGVRAGGDDVGRRAVGELRAGVTAKQAEEGLLLATSKLGGEGERELRAAAAPPLTVLDGDAFADALVGAGVGVVRNTLPITYLDVDLLTELAENKS